MMLFLKLNGMTLVATGEEKITLMLNIADGTYDHQYIARWIQEHLTAEGIASGSID